MFGDNNNMKIDIFRDEMFPVYYCHIGLDETKPWGSLAEISEEDLIKGREAEEAFEAWQVKLNGLWQQANPGKR